MTALRFARGVKLALKPAKCYADEKERLPLERGVNRRFAKGDYNMLEFKFDTQLLIEGHDLDEDEINDYITEHFRGDCLLAVGDDELIKIHFHTNEPWQVLEYCASLGEIHDIVVENMQLQSEGQHG